MFRREAELKLHYIVLLTFGLICFPCGSALSQVQQDLTPQGAQQAPDSTTTPPPVEKNYLKEGVAAYNSGRYREAIGLLGTALSSDFNNAVLHYYMANSFVHLKQPESAVREFRIAYALEPNKDVGKFSRQALVYMGAMEEDKSAAEMAKMEKAPPAPPRNPLMDQALQSMHKQAENLSGINKSQTNQMTDLARRQQEQMERARTD